MENVALIILLLLALALIGVVLLQRSEGGGLGMGGGGTGMAQGRAPGSPLGKLTWILGVAFMAMSLVMTVIAANNSAGTSVLDRITDDAPAREAPASDEGGLLGGGSLLPPSNDGNATPTAE